MATPEDPNRIDISLGLVDETSLAAIRALTDQLAANAQLLNSLQSTNEGDYIKGQRGTARALGRSGSSPGASYGHTEAPPPPRADTRSFRQRLRDVRERGLDSEVAQYGVTEREQYLYRTGQGFDNDPHWQSLRGHADSYEQDFPPGGPDTPGGAGANASRGTNDPLWRQTLMANPKRWERSQERVQLPQFGELTIQDKLNLASDLFARQAERRYQRGVEQANAVRENAGVPIGPLSEIDQSAVDSALDQGSTSSSRPGMMASYLQMGAEQAGQLVTAGREIKRFAGMFQGMSGRGTDLGYSRGGVIGIPGTDIGFANPFSSAAKEGARQSLTATRLSLQGGINKQQAREITDSLAGYGWSGDEAQGLAFDAVAPLVSKGFDAGDVTSLLDRTMRQGNSSVKEFVNTMSQLQDVAKTVNLTLPETVNQMKEFIQFGTTHGATAAGALKQGSAISAANGLAPGVNAEIAQNSLFQGIATSQGFLPGQIGLMSANQFNKTTYATLDLLQQATAGYRNRSIKDPETGETMTGEEAQYAAMAEFSGMSVDTIRRLMRERNSTMAAGRAGGRIRQLETNIQARESYKDSLYKKYGMSDHEVNSHFSLKGIYSPDDTRATHAKAVKAQVEAELQKNFGSLSGLDNEWHQIRGDLESLAPGRAGDKNNKDRVRYFEQIRDLEKKNGRERTQAAMALLNKRRDALSGANGDDDVNPDKVTIDLSDSAKRWFKVQQSKNTSQAKRDAQGGGKSTLSQIADGWTQATGIPQLLGLD